jgi:nucleotide sugar dehydrogenase
MNSYANDLRERIKERSASISVIGLGYVGLNISLAFANKGFVVNGYDIDRSKIEKLNRGENYIKEEKNLDSLLPRVLGINFHPSHAVEEASETGDVIIIIVPTAEGGVPTLSYLGKALDSVRRNDIRGKLIVIESTVKVGTTEVFVRSRLENGGLRAGDDFFIAYSPERIDPGNSDMTFNRIPKVLGGIEEQSTMLGVLLYEHVVDEVVRVSNTRTAEFVKLMENTQRDVNIALTNLFAQMCESSKIDVEEAIRAASTKWNFHRYRPSCGVGGHCLKKDPVLLAQSFEDRDIDLSLIYSSRRINDMMSVLTADKAVFISQHILNKGLDEVRIGIMGLSYKKNSSDTRNSPAFSIISHLKAMGVTNIEIFDPLVNPEQGSCISDIQESDVIIQTVAHNGFDEILDEFDGFIIDGTNTMEPGPRVCGIGRVLERLKVPMTSDIQNVMDATTKKDATVELQD